MFYKEIAKPQQHLLLRICFRLVQSVMRPPVVLLIRTGGQVSPHQPVEQGETQKISKVSKVCPDASVLTLVPRKCLPAVLVWRASAVPWPCFRSRAWNRARTRLLAKLSACVIPQEIPWLDQKVSTMIFYRLMVQHCCCGWLSRFRRYHPAIFSASWRVWT